MNPAADDPLFRPIDADDFRTNGAAATEYKNLTHGLVRITFNLPANVKLIDPATNAPSAETFVDLWRSVPSVNNVNVSGPDGVNPTWPPPIPPAFLPRASDGSQNGPNGRGGYQLDARIDTLQNQALGAFRGHAGAQVDPSIAMLNNLAAYQSAQVSPPEPALDALEQQGKAVFTRACGQCHGGAGLATPVIQVPAIVRYSDIASACPRPVDSPTWCVAGGGTAPCPPRFTFAACPSVAEVPGLAPRTYEITLSDGTTVRRTTSDPGRTILTGFVGSPGTPGAIDDWQKLDNAPLRGISKTAPYFHNNSAATLSDVVDHYDAFFKRVVTLNPAAAILTTGPGMGQDRPFTAAERPALLAYLQKL
jgi:hypothetical protein